MLSEAALQADSFSPQAVANLLWATATLRLDPGRELVRVLTLRSVQCAGEFNAQSISMLLWSLASSEHELSPTLAAAITQQAVECSNEFTPQGISNLFWALATLSVQPDQVLLHTLMRQATAQQHAFEPQATCNLLWSLASLGEQHLPDELFQALLEAIVRRAAQFQPQGVANTLWSLACLQPTNTEALRRALDVLSQRVLEEAHVYSDLQLRQIHQFLLETRLRPRVVGDSLVSFPVDAASAAWLGDSGVHSASLLAMRDKMQVECRRVFQIRKTRGSTLQREVGRTLQSMGYVLVEEASCVFSGYSLDFVVFSPIVKNSGPPPPQQQQPTVSVAHEIIGGGHETGEEWVKGGRITPQATGLVDGAGLFDEGGEERGERGFGLERGDVEGGGGGEINGVECSWVVEVDGPSHYLQVCMWVCVCMPACGHVCVYIRTHWRICRIVDAFMHVSLYMLADTHANVVQTETLVFRLSALMSTSFARGRALTLTLNLNPNLILKLNGNCCHTRTVTLTLSFSAFRLLSLKLSLFLFFPHTHTLSPDCSLARLPFLSRELTSHPSRAHALSLSPSLSLSCALSLSLAVSSSIFLALFLSRSLACSHALSRALLALSPSPSLFLSLARSFSRSLSLRTQGSKKLKGSTLLKNRQIQRMGYRLLNVPYFEWYVACHPSS